MGSLGPYRGQRRQHTFRDPPRGDGCFTFNWNDPAGRQQLAPRPCKHKHRKSTCGARDAILFWVYYRSSHFSSTVVRSKAPLDQCALDASHMVHASALLPRSRRCLVHGGRTSLSPDVGAVRPALNPIPASVDATPFTNGNPAAQPALDSPARHSRCISGQQFLAEPQHALSFA